jgi:hypothetical protein
MELSEYIQAWMLAVAAFNEATSSPLPIAWLRTAIGRRSARRDEIMRRSSQRDELGASRVC